MRFSLVMCFDQILSSKVFLFNQIFTGQVFFGQLFTGKMFIDQVLAGTVFRSDFY